MPRRRVEASVSRNSLVGTARPADPAAGVPGLPDWQAIPTPGHTPGHVAFFRSKDRVLITGDAVLTTSHSGTGAWTGITAAFPVSTKASLRPGTRSPPPTGSSRLAEPARGRPHRGRSARDGLLRRAPRRARQVTCSVHGHASAVPAAGSPSRPAPAAHIRRDQRQLPADRAGTGKDAAGSPHAAEVRALALPGVHCTDRPDLGRGHNRPELSARHQEAGRGRLTAIPEPGADRPPCPRGTPSSAAFSATTGARQPPTHLHICQLPGRRQRPGPAAPSPVVAGLGPRLEGLEGLDGTAVMIESIAGVPGRFLRLGGDGCQAARWACLARSSKAA